MPGLRQPSSISGEPPGANEATPSRFRLAVIDLDDTLLGPDKQISAANAEAVHSLQARGLRVILASGRRHENMLRFHRALGLSGPLVSCGGALTQEAETGEILHEQRLPAELATKLVAEGRTCGLSVIYYHPERVYVQEQTPWTDLYQHRAGEAPTVHDLSQLAGAMPLKLIWCGPPEQIAALLQPLQALYQGRLEVLTTDPEYLEFTAAGINKAVGLSAVVQRYGIEPAQVLAFGDGNNDVAMLQWAGLGVAMSHARPSAKAAAQWVAPAGDAETSFARAVASVFNSHLAQ